MKKSLKTSPRNWRSDEEIAREEIARTNARLRHFRGIAASVMKDALDILNEIWDSCEDPRSPKEILDGVPEPVARTPVGGWAEFYERLHLLGTYLDYARRLCEGSIDQQSSEWKGG
ncbi:MAG: hypothetical protein FJ126_11320 [Deltaproteobacteria bacterium]|nr:hypothetical protein [Deltaproteobacteria bacterium]